MAKQNPSNTQNRGKNQHHHNHEYRYENWVWAVNSNVAVAKDRSWFTSYTPFESEVTSSLGGAPNLRVCGVGTVELKIKTSTASDKKQSSRLLVLHDVLHIPASSCNIIINLIPAYHGLVKYDQGWRMMDPQGRCIAVFKVDDGLKSLVLDIPERSGPRPPENKVSRVYCSWPDKERERWAQWQRRNGGHAEVRTQLATFALDDK